MSKIHFNMFYLTQYIQTIFISTYNRIKLLLSLFSHSVLSDSLQLLGLQHARLPCPSLSPRGCSNSCPLSWWCQPTISSSVIPFSSCSESFPASESFPVSQLFTSSDQRIGASASILSVNIQGWFPLEWTGLISLLSKGLSRVFSSTTVWKHQFMGLLYGSCLTSVHDYWKNWLIYLYVNYLRWINNGLYS